VTETSTQTIAYENFRTIDPNWQTRIVDSFAQQSVMSLLGAQLGSIKPGYCQITLPFRKDLCQQDGFFHAGITSTIADSAGGYAAYSLMSADSRVLTVEFKINLLAPAQGDRLLAQGRVRKAGRTLTITLVDVFAVSMSGNKLCASMTQTLMCLPG